MNQEHPNKQAIQNHWWNSLEPKTRETYEGDMIEEKFEETHPTNLDKIDAKENWIKDSDTQIVSYLSGYVVHVF